MLSPRVERSRSAGYAARAVMPTNKLKCLTAGSACLLVVVACGASSERATSLPPSTVVAPADAGSDAVANAVAEMPDASLHAHAPVTAGYDIPDEAMRASMEAVVETTSRIVESAAFKEHLEHLTDLRAGPTAPIVPSDEVYRSYVGLDAASHPGPISYRRKMKDGKHLPCHMTKEEHAAQPTLKGAEQTADTVFKGAAGSTIELNQCTFERAAARPDQAALTAHTADVSMFACAINAIAHEWTHTVFDAAGHQRYKDRGHDGEKLVSYTVGAVAQCTYLESIGYLPDTFDECVDAVGTSILKRAPCKPGWAKPTATLH